jgi:1,4-alpha-glucan branching enzyme
MLRRVSGNLSGLKLHATYLVMINLNEVGAVPRQDGAGNWHVDFGIYLPNITFHKGYAVKVRVIHEEDQFVRGIEPRDFHLNWVNGSDLDLWQGSVPLNGNGTSHFGQLGNYLYRFQLLRGNKEVTFWFSDPFGRKAGLGTLSAFSVTGSSHVFAWSDAAFSVPEVDDMIVYELNVREFNRDFDGIVDQLDYLAGLGVNVLELMPVGNVKEDVEWGYTPLSYFAPEDRLGGTTGLKRLVNECHQRGIAVILDAVYAHAHPEFAYNLVYETSGEPNPMMGEFSGEFFAGRPGTDYTKEFTRDYFFQLNQYWMREYHVDGFRYDYVPGMYDGPVGQGYANLVFKTYQDSKDFTAFPRFNGGSGRSKIIQCAEHLSDPSGILSQTYSNCAWQNGLLDRARDMARWDYVTEHIAHRLDPEFLGFPAEFQNNATGDRFPVAPFQYVESHDHPRFLNQFGQLHLRDLLGEFYGDREKLYKVQPFVIGLYTAKGIPMLWHGQEFGENWGVPNWGVGRNLFERPLHWEYFYDPAGKALVRLHRILGTLRRQHRALKSRGYFYYYFDTTHLNQKVIAYRRDAAAIAGQPAESMVVVLNFSNHEQNVWIEWPSSGNWRELIDIGARPDLSVAHAGQWLPVRVSSNYGAIFHL